MIVIPMAGFSRRFREAGYDRPKHALVLDGRTLFAHAVASFEADFAAQPFLFVTRADDDAPAFVRQEAEALGVVRAGVVVLDAPTAGQAETVERGLDQAGVGDGEPVTIFNIDTFRPGFRFPDAPWAAQADGWLEVMRSSDPGLSYARPDPRGNGRVAETAEKRVISDLASTGMYHFARAGDFRRALAAERRSPTAPELYVAPLYNHLIGAGADIRYVEVGRDQVIFCGVPAEYEALRGSYPERMSP